MQRSRVSPHFGGLWAILAVVIIGLLAITIPGGSAARQVRDEQLWRFRNLGKAFYENPTTHAEAVEQFKKALDLAPDSAQERLNYGLALLRAGQIDAGVAQLERVQREHATIPHTWFNLGIQYKRQGVGQFERAISQFETMVRLVPDEPVSRYNLGNLYRLVGRNEDALKEMETAAKLDPGLAGPHFQLYNMYRVAGRSDEASREFSVFQEIKRRQAGAAVPEDLEWSIYAEILEPIGPAPADDSVSPAPLRFQDTRVPEITLSGGRVVTADLDADGHPDLIGWSADGIRLLKNGLTPLSNTGLEEVRGIRDVAAGDYNNDGFLDLCVLTDTGAYLYKNTSGHFERVAISFPPNRFTAAVWIDFDHDYDLDLVLVGPSSSLLRNNGEAGFSNQSGDFPFLTGQVSGAQLLNLVPDTVGRDLFVTYTDRSAVLYRDLLAGKFEARVVDQVPAGARLLGADDVNGDGRADVLVAIGDQVHVLLNRDDGFQMEALSSSGGTVALTVDFENRGIVDLVTSGHVFRNAGASEFRPVTDPAVGEFTAAASGDFNGDGRTDLPVIRPDGSLHMLRNDTKTSNSWVSVALTGIRNLRLAPQAQVEIKAGTRYQKKVYEGTPLLFGVGNAAQIDTVRITWPNGLVQNEIRQPVSTAGVYKEAQRLSGSCPMVFTWDGRSFRFITDVLGVAPLGASAGDGTFFPVDHDEYVLIPGEALTAVGGMYEIRITEELHEVAYLDQVQLMAVDHPADLDLVTNEKFKSPPFPEFKLFGVKRRIPAVRAHDDLGTDVTGALAARDRVYVDSFARDYTGVARLHTLDLDFGNAAPDNRAVLILNGWVDWADGSTFRRVSQQDSAGLVMPSLQVKDARGQWQTVIEDMGIPAGKPKTIAVDLTSRFLSASREVRIVTNLCLYWDTIFLSEDVDAPVTVVTRVNPTTAQLRFRGFSTPHIHPERKQPETFEYERVLPFSMWNPTPGLYTRYGEVQPLVSSADDRLSIMGSGDELRLMFSAASLPRVPANWTRDFLLLVDGWAKDADANTAFSQSVEPLPFQRMTAYPYSSAERFPDDALHREYRERYNTRPALRLLRPLRVSSQADGMGNSWHSP